MKRKMKMWKCLALAAVAFVGGALFGKSATGQELIAKIPFLNKL